MNKKAILFIIAGIWIAIAVFLIISKEQILSEGKVVLLETVPVDPRDMLRGDYVVLNYKISNINLNGVRSELNNYNIGQYVMVNLEQEGKFWQPKAVGITNLPQTGVNIRGKIKDCGGISLRLEYGIESYFVPEGKGNLIADYLRRGSGKEVGVEVSVGNRGDAIIKRILIDDIPVKFN